MDILPGYSPDNYDKVRGRRVSHKSQGFRNLSISSTKFSVVYHERMECNNKDVNIVTNFIQLVSPQPVDLFSQTKLHWKAPNEGYPHICGMYKSNNK